MTTIIPLLTEAKYIFTACRKLSNRSLDDAHKYKLLKDQSPEAQTQFLLTVDKSGV